MATDFDLPLLITFVDIERRAKFLAPDFEDMNDDEKDAILQFVHDFLILDADVATPGDSLYGIRHLKQLQTALGAWYASFTIDTPAGTGSQAQVEIDSFTVKNTMAKNNSTAKDLMNANQYGTEAYHLMNQIPRRHMMV